MISNITSTTKVTTISSFRSRPDSSTTCPKSPLPFQLSSYPPLCPNFFFFFSTFPPFHFSMASQHVSSLVAFCKSAFGAFLGKAAEERSFKCNVLVILFVKIDGDDTKGGIASIYQLADDACCALQSHKQNQFFDHCNGCDLTFNTHTRHSGRGEVRCEPLQLPHNQRAASYC